MGHMHPQDLSIAQFTYELPEGRIARQPLAERDGAKLLLAKDGRISDHGFTELPALLPPNTLLVLNETRVISARIAFQRSTGARLECMVLEPADGRPMEQALAEMHSSRWWCMMGNAKRWKGEVLSRLHNGQHLEAERIDQRDGEHLIEFRWKSQLPFVQVLGHFGAMPLPPYMRRDAVAEDEQRYNTVFATNDGSVAAPTASLHLSGAMLDALHQRGVRHTRLTLHVGAGTFLPVKSQRMEGHAMHREQVRIPRTTVEELLAQLGQGPIVPVGTTALRTLESLYWHGVMILQGRATHHLHVEQWEPYGHQHTELPTAKDSLNAVLKELDDRYSEITGGTSLLIAPGYRFRIADALVTNFHQPQSTLLLLVAAFVGPGWREVYQHALANDYRFLSYGDGSLLFKQQA